jgi:PTS system nitrogen regulatory IIA component
MDGSCCFCAGAVQEIASTDKFSAIGELIRKAPALAQVADREEFERCVITREKVRSTGLGRGVAVAHGKTCLVDHVILTLGISRSGIPFESPDGAPVNLLFLIASPPERQVEYLVALSTIARLFRGALRQRVLETGSIEVVQDMLAREFREALLARGGVAADTRIALGVH